jgi:hypothetical protein
MRVYLYGFGILGVFFLSVVLFTKLDTTYVSVKHSFNNSKEVYGHDRMVSPNQKQYELLLMNHWKISPIFSSLEDVFYPFRQWKNHPIEALQLSREYTHYNEQLNHISTAEKATKVRALKAYTHAKRKNFRDERLNNDFEQKQLQWVGVFKNQMDRRIALMNGDYNTLWLAGIGLGGAVAVLVTFGGVSTAVFGVAALLLGLFVASYAEVMRYNIPLHWVVLLFFIGRNAGFGDQKMWHNVLVLVLPALAASASFFGGIVGLLAMGWLWRFPTGIRWLSPLLWLHPFGAWFALKKDDLIRHRFLMWVVSWGALFILNSTQFPLAFSSPLMYQGSIGIAINSVIIMAVCACLLNSKSAVVHNQRSGMVALVLIGLVVAQVAQSPMIAWVYGFLWNPLIEWGSLIAICLMGAKKQLRLTSQG